MTDAIEHVSDTAFWVASFRALESERPDAVFSDPLARVLVGEKGDRIAKSIGGARTMAFIMVARTSAIDGLILSAIERGVDTVLNLGAGLDTRPYRMKLPASLRWIEADFPRMIDFKNDKLAGEQPVCGLERVGIDLADREARRALLARVSGSTRAALVITEGVITYLSAAEAGRLAEDVHAEASLRFWIQDYYSARVRRRQPRWRRKMRAAPLLFSAPDWFGFFGKYGFHALEKVSIAAEARRIRRRPPWPWSVLVYVMPARWLNRDDGSLGYTLLERGAVT
ncbi:MAG: class I SAM-dependent methyltransferase [Polyangiaceae bacterium]